MRPADDTRNENPPLSQERKKPGMAVKGRRKKGRMKESLNATAPPAGNKTPTPPAGDRSLTEDRRRASPV